jgi:hypothetical protein
MSKLSEAKNAVIPKPFISTDKCHIEASVNTLNQFVQFKAKCNGNELVIDIEDMQVEAAWKQIEKFICKHHKLKNGKK